MCIHMLHAKESAKNKMKDMRYKSVICDYYLWLKNVSINSIPIYKFAIYLTYKENDNCIHVNLQRHHALYIVAIIEDVSSEVVFNV